MSAKGRKKNERQGAASVALPSHLLLLRSLWDAEPAPAPEGPWTQYRRAQALGGAGESPSAREARVELLRRAAQGGHPGAQGALAAAFERGDGVEHCPLLAAYWRARAALKLHTPALWDADAPAELVADWQRKAESGDSIAQFSVGWLHDEGVGMPPNAAEAVAHYLRAAKAGHTGAARNLGRALLSGHGTRRDAALAVVWLYRAARAGHPQAQADLGALFRTGEGGVARDDAEAVRWLRQAAVQGEAAAMVDYAKALQQRRHVQPTDTEQPLYFLKLAALQGSAKAYVGLSQYFQHMSADGAAEQAFRWALAAATEGNRQAQAQVGRFYADGWGCEADAFAAVAWLRRALAATDAAAKGSERDADARKLLSALLRHSPQLREWRHALCVALCISRTCTSRPGAARAALAALPLDLLVYVLTLAVRPPRPTEIGPTLRGVLSGSTPMRLPGVHASSQSRDNCLMS